MKPNIKELADFLKESVNTLITTKYTCCEYKLDKDLSVFVGWTDGYDPDDEGYIHAKEEPTFVVAAKIASNHEYLKTDLDWLVQPYYESDGEVWDTEITLTESSNFEEDADWFLKNYENIRVALDKGELLLESKNLDKNYSWKLETSRDLNSEELSTFIEKIKKGYHYIEDNSGIVLARLVVYEDNKRTDFYIDGSYLNNIANKIEAGETEGTLADNVITESYSKVDESLDNENKMVKIMAYGKIYYEFTEEEWKNMPDDEKESIILDTSDQASEEEGFIVECDEVEIKYQDIDKLEEKKLKKEDVSNWNDLNEGLKLKIEAKFKDKVRAIKRSLKKNDKRLSDETAQKSAERIAGSMIKNESYTNQDELEELANDIIDFMGADMGTWFDEIQGNEEEVFYETLAILEGGDENQIQILIDNVTEADIDEDTADEINIKSSKNLVNRIKKLTSKKKEETKEIKSEGWNPDKDLYVKLMKEIQNNLGIDWYEIHKEADAIKFRYNGNVYFAEPRSTCQVDIFDDNHKQIGWGVVTSNIKQEVFTEYNNNDYLYELVGGEYAGTYTREEAEKLPIKEPELTADLDDVRANGGFVHRKELDNQLQFKGYLGPMWNGTKDGNAVIRYETQEVYDMLSESKKLNENKTEDYWDAKELVRDGFVALLKFNFGVDKDGNNYMITKDAHDIRRFHANTDKEAIEFYNKWKNAERNAFGDYILDENESLNNGESEFMFDKYNIRKSLAGYIKYVADCINDKELDRLPVSFDEFYSNEFMEGYYTTEDTEFLDTYSIDELYDMATEYDEYIIMCEETGENIKTFNEFFNIEENKLLQEDEIIDRPEDLVNNEKLDTNDNEDVITNEENTSKSIIDSLSDRIGQQLEAGRLNAILQSVFGMFNKTFILPSDLYNMNLNETQELTVFDDGDEYTIYFDIIDIDNGIIEITGVDLL